MIRRIVDVVGAGDILLEVDGRASRWLPPNRSRRATDGRASWGREETCDLVVLLSPLVGASLLALRRLSTSQRSKRTPEMVHLDEEGMLSLTGFDEVGAEIDDAAKGSDADEAVVSKELSEGLEAGLVMVVAWEDGCKFGNVVDEKKS